MRVLVAPDKFKGTLTAGEAAEAIARGWRRAQPSAEIETVPMADGGEGTLDALLAALGGERHRVTVSDPLGDPVEAEFGIAPTEDGPLAIIEMARASGLALISPARRDPKRTSTRGTGDLILHACRRGVKDVLVCIGGSATNDAGAGMAQALGVRLLDEEGRDLRPGGASLLRLGRIDMRTLDPAARAARFVVATDVDNPLVGPQGASAVYGPQKGASPEDVALLDKALGHFAAVVHRDLAIDVRNLPGAGAAGGLGAGLIAFLGARIRPGVAVVMEAVRLPERLARADLVITGEGTFDDQSFHGKAPAGVLLAAREAGVPAVVLCGQSRVSGSGARAFALADRFGLDASLERAPALLEDLAAEVARGARSRGASAEVG
ncbi:MAG: glycerate kinase family protein [Actinomycetota bacterium]